MSIRDDVKQLIEEAFTGTPLEGIKVVTSDRAIDRPTKPFLVVASRGWARFPAAPMTYLNAQLVVKIVSPNQDLDKAEAQLDDIVPEVMNALDRKATIAWTEATKSDWGDSLLSYELPITVITSKEV